MPELIAKANQVILESRYLQREGRSLRFQASILASQLGQTLVRRQGPPIDLVDLEANRDQASSQS